MERKRYVVMGAGEVGFHLARSLSEAGHEVVVVEADARKRDRVEELDVAVVIGNGAHVPVLRSAGVERSELFMAVSSSDEANFSASLLARRLGARRTVVRVGVAEDVTTHRRIYEDTFGVDLLLSTQLLATTRILNHILGHNTIAVEYLARGKVQLRKIRIEEGSLLTSSALRELTMPDDSLVVGLFRGDDLIIPAGDDHARPGDDALILGKTGVIDKVERLVSCRPRQLRRVVIAGGSTTAVTVAQALHNQADRVKLIEKDRGRAVELAGLLPNVEVLHGDATDPALLRSERIGDAQAFVALSGNDETNLMATLLAREEGVEQVIALVERSETTALWKRLRMVEIVSPRAIASRRIREYIDNGYNANIVSLKRGAAQVLERRLAPASPAAGVTLAEMNPPRGLIVGAVVRPDPVRGERVFVPRGQDRLEPGDTVILFVHADELATVQLLFPGHDHTPVSIFSDVAPP
ncbi:MAG: Trk system potassium transporter TrkA [Acidobacteriota bacterium]